VRFDNGEFGLKAFAGPKDATASAGSLHRSHRENSPANGEISLLVRPLNHEWIADSPFGKLSENNKEIQTT
jgi:hypothetical protein